MFPSSSIVLIVDGDFNPVESSRWKDSFAVRPNKDLISFGFSTPGN